MKKLMMIVILITGLLLFSACAEKKGTPKDLTGIWLIQMEQKVTDPNDVTLSETGYGYIYFDFILGNRLVYYSYENYYPTKAELTAIDFQKITSFFETKRSALEYSEHIMYVKEGSFTIDVPIGTLSVSFNPKKMFGEMTEKIDQNTYTYILNGEKISK